MEPFFNFTTAFCLPITFVWAGGRNIIGLICMLTGGFVRKSIYTPVQLFTGPDKQRRKRSVGLTLHFRRILRKVAVLLLWHCCFTQEAGHVVPKNIAFEGSFITLYGYASKGPKLERLTCQSILQCGHLCLKNPKCVSFSWWPVKKIKCAFIYFAICSCKIHINSFFVSPSKFRNQNLPRTLPSRMATFRFLPSIWQ